MFYTCTLTTPLQISRGVSIVFSPVIEVSLACHRCRRAGRTIVLGDSPEAQHWGGATNHAFHGRVAAFHTEPPRSDGDGFVITASFRLEYEFEPFEDSKYPAHVVSPLPTWGRVHLSITCPCARVRETSTQTNIVRPRNVRCECGQILLVEREQVILFSKPELLHDHMA
jgi:hypothetical protein